MAGSVDADAKIKNTLLKLNYVCHNQAEEWHVKVVTYTSAQLVGFKSRNGLKRQKPKSHKL